MTSIKLQIINELNEAERMLVNSEALAYAYPNVQELLDDIIEKVAEVKEVVRKVDEFLPKGQTKITEGLNGQELRND